MATDDLKLLRSALGPLGLELGDRVPPWGLGQPFGQLRVVARAPVPIAYEPVLAAPAPLPYELEPDLLLGAFPSADRSNISAQIDATYDALRVFDIRRPDPNDPVVRVQFGVPLIGQNRALVRIRTSNHYPDLTGAQRLVNSDFHAWISLDGRVLPRFDAAAKALAEQWPLWSPGRSPGLPARVDVNRASEVELLRLPGMTRTVAKALLAARPLDSPAALRSIPGLGPKRLAALEIWVEVADESSLV